MRPFAELSSSLALARRVLAGGRLSRTTVMDGLRLTGTQWGSIVAAWDQEPSRRPVLSSDGGPMIFSWRPETETVHSIRHQPDLSAEEALNALNDLSTLMVMFGSSGSFRELINVFSFIVRLGRIRIRRHEDALLRSIHERVLLQHEPADYDSPYFKIFLLLQAHFSRLPLSPELTADLTIVLERVFSLFSVCAHDSDVNTDNWMLDISNLMRMCVHGMWDHDPALKQIPHFEDDVSCSITRQGLRLIHASGPCPFQCGQDLLRARGRQHGCASTQRPPEDGRSEDVRQHAT
jgi:hypothetical protein